MKKRFISFLLVITALLGLVGANTVFAATMPSISSSKPISSYTLNGSGKVYAYTDASLKTKTGGYIACSTDLCKIIKISGNAVQVTYPVSGGTRTAWFSRSEFTSYNIASGSAGSWKQASKITTYRRSDGKTELGYISAGDVCYKLSTSGSYTQVIYPISGGYKMGWVKSSEIKSSSSSKSLSDVALGEVGYQGTGPNGKGTGDYTKYGVFTGTNGQAWCASFVSWCVNQAGVSTAIVPKSASCNTMKNNSNSYHKWSSSALKTIKKNDVIFFSTGSQDSHHVGIVYSVSGSNITVIEGNTSQDTVAKNTYTVNSSDGKITKGWSGHYFCGYISVN